MTESVETRLRQIRAELEIRKELEEYGLTEDEIDNHIKCLQEIGADGEEIVEKSPLNDEDTFVAALDDEEQDDVLVFSSDELTEIIKGEVDDEMKEIGSKWTELTGEVVA